MNTARDNFEPIPHMGIARLKLDLSTCATLNMADGSYSIPTIPLDLCAEVDSGTCGFSFQMDVAWRN